MTEIRFQDFFRLVDFYSFDKISFIDIDAKKFEPLEIVKKKSGFCDSDFRTALEMLEEERKDWLIYECKYTKKGFLLVYMYRR